MRIYRICRERYAGEAYNGEGARRYGGRWNSRGVPMVYSSSSLSLAALELFIHLEPNQAPDDLVSIAATLPDGEPALRWSPEALPPNWHNDGLGTMRRLGDEWMAGLQSLAVLVPSVPIPEEWNILLNPLHARIKELEIDSPKRFCFDPRMFSRES